jgi:hypothetical protein
MHLIKAATILTVLTLLLVSAALAQGDKSKGEPASSSASAQKEGQESAPVTTRPRAAFGNRPIQLPTPPLVQPVPALSAPIAPLAPAAPAAPVGPLTPVTPLTAGVSLVGNQPAPEFLSGKVTVTVRGNDNPIIRVGLASSGVTLVEFPGSDRFFALHPGNSELVTIDESPTKKDDHFFVFRAGSNFLAPPPSPKLSPGPAASIIAQMRSGLVVTFLVYPVRQLEEMAHTVVILYDRGDIVAARRAAGLAVNLEEGQSQQQRSIRIAQPDTTAAVEKEHGGGAASDGLAVPVAAPNEPHPASGGSGTPAASPALPKADDKLIVKTLSTEPLQQGPLVNPLFESEARNALRNAITSSRFKNWTMPLHGLSLSTSSPREIKDGSASVVIIALRNTLTEPARIVPGQPELSVETRDKKGKILLLESLKKLHVESSGLGNSVPAVSTLYFAIVYKRPILGVNQHLRVSASQMDAADEPAVFDLTASR